MERIKMKPFIVILLSFIMVFLLGMITKVYGMRIGYNQSGITINVTKGANNTGVYYNMGENPQGMFQEGIFCIQQGQTLHSWASRDYYNDYTTFTSTREAVINGENTYWRCINGAQASVNTKASVIMAWIMCQSDDRFKL